MIISKNNLKWIEKYNHYTLYLDLFTISICSHYDYGYNNDITYYTYRIDGAKPDSDSEVLCRLLATSTTKIKSLYEAKRQALNKVAELLEENTKDIKRLITILPIRESLV